MHSPTCRKVTAYPQLSGQRLLREIQAHGCDGGYTAVTDFLPSVIGLAGRLGEGIVTGLDQQVLVSLVVD